MDRFIETHRGIPSGRHVMEVVTPGDADKVADIIADAIVDAALARSPDARVSLDVAVHDHEVRVFGSLEGVDELDIEGIALGVLRDAGYDDVRWGLDLGRVRVRSRINAGSPNIPPDGGRQVVVRGLAVEGPGGLPSPLLLGRNLIGAYESLRKAHTHLGPDARVLVGVDYEGGRPARLASVVFSAQHDPSIDLWALRDLIYDEVILANLGALVDDDAEILINPGGRFVLGGPVARIGLTGRRTDTDTYGGIIHPGTTALSGRDGGQLERCAVYAARDIALDILDAWQARIAEVQLVFPSGISTPISLQIATDTAAEFKLQTIPANEAVERLTIEAMKPLLRFEEVKFRDLATFGHFGRSHLPWEEPREATDRDEGATLENAKIRRPADAPLH